MPDRANSFPKQNGHQPETTRYQSGFPNTMWGEPNDFVGSAPAQDRNAFDKYRAALANGGQAPAGSPFDRQYQAYKQQDDTAKVVREKYKKFSTSYKPPSKDQIAQSPQSYAGQPKATQDWHQSAAAKAGDAGDAFQR
ncbi:hypothetical protein N7517_001690 [Penicillium concentricum]|uniref:Uncharacterized protein n=1 Tax=Penicillium concentricum TaxID=293559 RepID=A0A9W9SUI3_9EURO|nr:uncharacterized protein N7517_001690 [Penicillium concentricum]KAJ5383779.1 hypothetical protein N7517_001690 [Penicillium concentricum]